MALPNAPTNNATSTQQSTNNSNKITTQLGGRTFAAHVTIVDGNPSTTDPVQVAFNTQLLQYAQSHIPMESTLGITTRERVLERMTAIANEWVQSVVGTTNTNARCHLLTSGSYRLGVHEPGADIDTILVAPAVCQRSDFFGTTVGESEERDPSSLAERIRHHPDVTNFVPVEGAAVPLLTFDWDGINIDLLFARLQSHTVPVDFDVNRDAVLDGVDSATEKSLNGPRVTNLIAEFCSGTPERYTSFLTTVRCVRKWAKARGLYSNKMGYWGGVNINIAVAVTIQLYPNLSPAQLLGKFFLAFGHWQWPEPVLLTDPYDAGYGLPCWSRQGQRHVAPMITPAYPAMNSTLSVSRQSLQILQKELKRGSDRMEALWREFQWAYAEEGADATVDWDRLFAPSEFFIQYPHYVSLCIVGPSQSDVQAWAGFVESRLRKLVSDLLSRSLPLQRIQLWPKKIEACIADASSLLSTAQRQNCLTYFIGFHVDRGRMRGDVLNLEGPLVNFRDWDLVRFQPLVHGMDVLTKVFTVQQLPRLCFESLGGKDVAMRKLRQLRSAKPSHQEMKKQKMQANLAAMKAKMDAIQKKKRKRSEDDVDGSGDESGIKAEGDGDTTNDAVMEDAPVDAVKGEDDIDVAMNDEAIDADGDIPLPDDLEDGGEVDQDGYESDENVVGYSKDNVRQVIGHTNKNKPEINKFRGKRLLPLPDDLSNALQTIGYSLRDESTMNIIGSTVVAKETKEPPRKVSGTITFVDKFDIVELDADGRVIDKGDADFSPSKGWTGRKPGFEFKLGERGLGYYRTGKKVVVPSNTTY